MEKIRIGNDIELRWKVYTAQDENTLIPYDLTGRELKASLRCDFGETPVDFRTEENELIAIFRGKDQKALGQYYIILRENDGKDAMKTVDTQEAFELVPRTMDESHSKDGVVRCFHLTFESVVGSWSGTIDPILNHDAEVAEAQRKKNEEGRVAAEQARQEASAEAVASANAAAENANIKAKEANNAAISANSAAKTANTAASNADNAAVTAQQKAEEANKATISANNATEAANVAAGNAQQQAQAANEAAASANNAATAANAAAENAQQKADAANAAAASANGAAEAADTAAGRANEAADKFNAAIVQETGDSQDKAMSQKTVTDALTASDQKLSELEEKVSEIGKESIDTKEESIVIKDNDGNVLAEITPEGSAFRNLKNNGKDVLTEHQDISGLATKDEIEKKQDRIDGLDSTQEETYEEEIVFGESDVDRTMTVRKDKIIVHKSLVDGEDNPIKSVEVGRKRNVYTLDSSLLSGLVWGGDKVYRGSDTANSYVIALDNAPLILSFVGPNPFSMVMFDTMPEIGSVGRKVDFTRCVQPSEGKYVMLYGKVSEFPSEIVVKKFGVGLTGLENLHDSLAGKTIAVFGDSVMEGVAAFDGVSCPEYLSMYTNAKVINCAIGGTRIVPRNTTSEVLDNTVTCYNRLDILNLISAKINGDLTEQINAAEWVGGNAGHIRAKVQVDKLNNLDLSSVDVFIIEGGCNDFMSAEKGKDEICQGLQRIIQILMTNFPNARIYYVCPTVEWYIDRDESHYSDVYDFGKGFTLKNLVEGLNKTAHDMCIPYYDAYHRLGWNRFNFNRYFRTNTTHPETGYEYMAQKIGAFLVNDMLN